MAGEIERGISSPAPARDQVAGASATSAGAESLTLSQRVLLALKETRSKLEAYERARSEPIAIIGIGCRFPGDADTPDLFWDLMCRGADAIREVPADRWDVEAYYDPDPAAPGKTCVRCGGFLRQVDLFDGQIFGISPREARSMDPQQRLLLEVAWEALEHAGQGHNDVFGRRVGVFVGIGNGDYGRLLHDFARPEDMDLYSTTGNVFSAAAGRLSYVLGLQGPSMSLDTACSSSLVAVHLACQSLRAQESVMALAGGVNLILSPDSMIAMSRIPGGVSPDGRCKTFDASANGIARGEGCGLVVLKRLTDAIRDRDNIIALIRGTAVNQDGRSAGLTVPNGQAQIALIEQALADAKVSPREISYVEAHGPGTALGDPIEAGALGAVFGPDRPRDRPLIVGSVKTNIGHLELAAGVAGLIKAALILQRGEVPANLHFSTPNPRIAWDQSPIRIPTERMPLPPQSKDHFAGVSSFGVTGTNAHAVLGAAPRRAGLTADESRHREAAQYLLTLSAKDELALWELCSRYERHLGRHCNLALLDVCHTASVGRCHFPHRLAVLAASAADMRTELERLRSTGPSARIVRGQTAAPPGIGFLFSDANAVPKSVVRELSVRCSAFRNAFAQCDALVQKWAGWSLEEVLAPECANIGLCGESQQNAAVVVSFGYALAELWRAWGVLPTVVAGRGAGVVTAACVAGMTSLEQALELALAAPALGGADRRVEGIDNDLLRVLSRIDCATARIPLVSALTGRRITDTASLFDDCVGTRESPAAAAGAGVAFQNEKADIVLEAGPGSSLKLCVEQLAELYVKGAAISWEGYYQDLPCSRVVLPTYPFQRQSYWFEKKEVRAESERSTTDPLDQHLYREEWRPQPLASEPRPSPVGTWIILADNTGIGRELASQLETEGNVCVIVRPGEGDAAAADGEVRVDPTRIEGFGRLLARLGARDSPPLRGIVHLWSIDAQEPSSLPQLKHALKAECGSLLHLARAVIDARLERMPNLWLVTRGAVQVDEMESPAIAQFPIWAMAGVIEHEYPELGCTRMDLPPAAGTSAAALLLREIRGFSDERRVAFRGEQRLVARLARCCRMAGAENPLALRPDATYLVTGGLGGLGGLVAEWLVGKGAKHIVLVGRSPPGPAAAAQIERLRAAGATVTAAMVDVSVAQELQGVLSRIDPSRPLCGIVHCAAVLDDGILANQTWERYERVFRPKVDGAWNLHRLTDNCRLDFFVLFSSASSLFGSPGQSNYAAANAFLDTLARWRRSRGMAGLSINWGIWSGVGRVAAGQLDITPDATGLGRIAPQQGLKALEYLLPHSSPQVAMIPIRWPEFLVRTGHWRLVDDFRDAAVAAPVSPFLASLEKAPAGKRKALLFNHVRSQVEQVLGMRSAGAVSATLGFFEMGMDSLTSVELKNRLQTTLGCKLPATLAFECPTVEALVNHLAQENLSRLFAPDPDVAPQPQATGDDRTEAGPTGQISEEEVNRLLDERLARVETFLEK